MKMNNNSDVDKENVENYNSYDNLISKDEIRSATIRNDRLLTVQELSNFLKVPKSYIYWLTHQKKIPYIKIHGHIRFWESIVDRWLRDQEVS